MKGRAAFPLIVVLLWATCGGAHAANKAKDQHTLDEYLSSLKEQPVPLLPGKTLEACGATTRGSANWRPITRRGGCTTRSSSIFPNRRPPTRPGR